jgi:ubiquinone/menaquinone biosynthesis C-methylase UbiE
MDLSRLSDAIKDARTAYDEWHANLSIEADPSTPWHRMTRPQLDPVRDLHEKTVLEIGCGRGDFACWLARHEVQPRCIVALDFSTVAVSKGSQFARGARLASPRFGVADIERLPHPDATFDTVFSFETIEHVPHPRAAVRELTRVLKPGGRLFLSTPNYMNASGLYRIYLRLRGRRFSEAGQPINQPLLLPWTRAWVAATGLRITHVQSTGHFIPTRPGHAAWEAQFLERVPIVSTWLGQESLIVAEKPLGA